ncbi:pilus assembly protein [Methylovorus sp. SPW-M1]
MLNRKPEIVVAVFLTWLTLLTATNASAALTDIAAAPISNNSGTVVKPNVMFVLDDSGSMDFNFLPDNVFRVPNGNNILGDSLYYDCRLVSGGSTKCNGGNIDGTSMIEGGAPPFYSYRFNQAYYNPNITYTPPVNPCDPSTNLPTQNSSQTNVWAAVRVNGLALGSSCGQTSATVKLVSGFPELVYCDPNNNSDCKRNGIDYRASGSYDDYDFPDNARTSPYTSTAGTYRVPKTKSDSSPHYYDIIPIEYCKKADLKDCSVQSAATATYSVPSYARYCNTETNAGRADNPPVNACQATYVLASSFKYVRYGKFKRVNIVSGATFPKADSRTDCSGSTCSYAEEMTNFANWYAYYRTRMMNMKSSAGRAFSSLDDAYRVGFITLNTASNKFLKLDTFNATNKKTWYQRLYGMDPSGGTPLREALSRVGRYYGGKTNGINSMTTDDPVQYSCQQNFTILTTDGYWNGNKGVMLDGATLISNEDSKDEGYSTRADGAYDGGLSGSKETLADVAMYYYKTDLRPSMAASDLLKSPTDSNNEQHMVTFTLGLGLNGELDYDPYYQTPQGDFKDIIDGVRNWPVPVADTLTAVDDLWHAAVNGRGRYFSASDPSAVTSGLQTALAAVNTKSTDASAATTSTPNLTSGDNYAFNSTYRTVKWDGEVVASTIDLTTGLASSSNLWSAQSQLDAKGGIDTDTRTILKMNTSRVLVKFDPATLSSTELLLFTNQCSKLSQCPVLNSPTQAIANNPTHLINFLRGQSQHENVGTTPQASKAFRDREHVLGDLANSIPAYVKAPRYNFGDYVSPSYGTFKTANINRPATLYVGGNDGMLHAFNADTGAERWAFVPRTVMSNMYALADKNYSSKHKYYVDGSPIVMDIFAGGGWKTILVGGLNGGGRGYYALDVTNPADPKGLWEFCSDSNVCDVADENLGYTFGNPVIGKLPNGTWVVMVTSGYNNVTPGDGKGYLYVLNALTGALIRKVSTGVGDTTTPSGLSRISGWSDNGNADATITQVYGGDLLGNVWRFNMSDYNVTTLAQLKYGNTAQPITTKPELAAISGSTAHIVYVATGSYLGLTDLTTTGVQTIYALRDTGTAISNARTNPITISKSGNTATVSGTGVNGSWYADLPTTGERVFVNPQLGLGTLVVASGIPSGDACSPGGDSWIYFFDYKTGRFTTSGTSAQGTYNSSGGLVTGLSLYTLPNGTLRYSTSTVGGDTTKTITTGGSVATSGSSLTPTRSSWREITTE